MITVKRTNSPKKNLCHYFNLSLKRGQYRFQVRLRSYVERKRIHDDDDDDNEEEDGDDENRDGDDE